MQAAEIEFLGITPVQLGTRTGVLLDNACMAIPKPAQSELDYFLVDVFTETAFAGNPLAVVFNTVGLRSEQMQSIAREFNLSETTFVERRSTEVEQREGVRVRIFTTEEELPFAGHPTLGTASVLRLAAPETVQQNTITLALNVGAVPVRFAAEGLFGEMTQRDPEFGAELEANEVARLIGLAEDDLDPVLPPQIVSTGNPFAIVALKLHDSLARLNVSQQQATDWLRSRGARWFYVLAPTGEDEPAWRARMQFNGGEDPATGSAAGCAISYLVDRGAVPSGLRVHLRQGVEMNRPSDLFLSAKIQGKAAQQGAAKVREVCVGGSTVLVAKGRLFL
jgi:trans-2,3-dihydro-3-hydroxyanthranilate isomerase